MHLINIYIYIYIYIYFFIFYFLFFIFFAVRYILKNSEKEALSRDQCSREFHEEERFKPMYQPEEDGYMVVSITESKFYTVFNMVVHVHIYLHVFYR